MFRVGTLVRVRLLRRFDEPPAFEIGVVSSLESHARPTILMEDGHERTVPYRRIEEILPPTYVLDEEEE